MSWLVRLWVPSSEVDAISADLWTMGTTGIAEMERDGVKVELVAGFTTQGQSTAAAESLGQHQAVSEEVPPWPTPEPETIVRHGLSIEIDAGRAFGHGGHPTTELALDLLLSLHPKGPVLDLGCGTGVLAIAAALSGASPVVAIDIDPVAVERTLANAATNGVALETSTTPLHELTALRSTTLFETIVANMLPVELEPLAGEMAARLQPGGRIVVSGFLSGHHQRVADFFPTLRLIGATENGDWGGLIVGSGDR